MTRKRRGLSPEERALWAKVADSARPLKTQPAVRPFLRPQADKPETPRPEPEPIAPFSIGQKAGTTPRSSTAPTAAPPVQMDRRAFTRMRRGKTRPDARIDLHGMTVSAAHPALTAFLLRAHADGKRLVLVITGKGRGGPDDGVIPERPGILRRQVPHWLQLPPLNRIVLQVAEAHQTHGGSGAFYVYLARQR